MKLLGILIILNALVVAAWFSISGTANKWIIVVCFAAIFSGIFFLVSDRATEVSVSGIGTIKAAVDRATSDAIQVAGLKARIEAQSATIDLVAKEAMEAKEVSESLKEKNRDAEEKLLTINSTLEKAAISLKGIQDVVDATKEYYAESQLNMVGKPFPDGDVVFNTPISQALEGTYTMNGNIASFKEDSVSEAIYRHVIATYPRFPFAYWYLAYTLRRRNDASWRAFA